MQVFLDEELIASDASTLEDGLRAGRDAAGAKGRVLVEATLDGEVVPVERLMEPGNDAGAPAEHVARELRFVSADPRALVRSTLLETCDALEASRKDHAEAAELIQTGEIEPALLRLSAAMGAWENVRRVVADGPALLGQDPASMRIPAPGGAGERPLSEDIDALASHLTEVKRAMQAADWSGLSDVLAYDLDGQIDRWREILPAMAEALAPRA